MSRSSRVNQNEITIKEASDIYKTIKKLAENEKDKNSVYAKEILLQIDERAEKLQIKPELVVSRWGIYLEMEAWGKLWHVDSGQLTYEAHKRERKRKGGRKEEDF